MENETKNAPAKEGAETPPSHKTGERPTGKVRLKPLPYHFSKPNFNKFAVDL